MTGKTVYKNALVRNSETGKSEYCSLVTQNGRITGIEPDDPGKAAGSCSVVDCEGRRLLPGFIDGHLHIPGDLLYQSFGIILSNADSFVRLFDILKDYMQKHKKTGCVRGYGWQQVMLVNGRDAFKTCEMLHRFDALFPDIPMVLFSADYHSCICNSKALLICGISAMTPNPPGGIIYKDSDGNPTGLLVEGAVQFIGKHLELGFDRNEMSQSVSKYQRLLHRFGITSVQSLMFIGGDGFSEWDILSDMHRTGKLKINVSGAIAVAPTDSPEAAIKRLKSYSRYLCDKISISTVKIYVDGVVENYTAALKKPYRDTGDCGMTLWEDRALKAMCRALVSEGIQIHAHAIGDKAVRDITNAFAYAQKGCGKNDFRNTIAHIQLCDLATIRKMSANSIIACLQPYWFPASPYYYEVDKRILGKRADYQYPMQSLMDNGVMVTGGSDSPVTSYFCPLLGISYAVNRKDKDFGWPAYNRGECTSVPDSVDSFTCNAAYQLKRENEIGQIRPGYYADFVLLSEDVYNVPKLDIQDIVPVMTVYRGEIVYAQTGIKANCMVYRPFQQWG